MNELSERDLKSIERIRDARAQLDPVPANVLAAARNALRQGLRHAPGAATSRPLLTTSEADPLSESKVDPAPGCRETDRLTPRNGHPGSPSDTAAPRTA
jgi:hypothetical protein